MTAQKFESNGQVANSSKVIGHIESANDQDASDLSSDDNLTREDN
jgi:hypothetical protein